MKSKYSNIREITPKEYLCIGGLGCPAVYEGSVLREMTPENMRCILATCPAIYESELLEDKTPDEMSCIVGGCYGIFESKRDIYLIIGKQIDPKTAGLEEKVGKDEALVEIPKGLLANINRDS